jgi:hypothetical protein
MTPFLRKLLGQNWLLLLTMLALAVFGVVAIYSATSTRADSYAADFWRKQANWVAVGVFAFMLTSLIHYRWVRWGALPMYLAGIVFLMGGGDGITPGRRQSLPGTSGGRHHQVIRQLCGNDWLLLSCHQRIMKPCESQGLPRF